MVTLDEATDAFGFGSPPGLQVETSHELLAPGLVSADLGDPDHVFLVIVRQVPRHRLQARPRPVLKRADGTTVVLQAVDLANHVTVVLTVVGEQADEAATAYRAALDAWGAAPAGDPPSYPGESLAQAVVHVGDDVGTRYAWTSAELGHQDDPWRYVLRFRPTPPPDARTVVVQVSGADPVVLDLPPWEDR